MNIGGCDSSTLVAALCAYKSKISICLLPFSFFFVCAYHVGGILNYLGLEREGDVVGSLMNEVEVFEWD